MTQGFTLVEILLVVVLLGVISAIAAPNFIKSHKMLQLQVVSDEMSYLMRYAQSYAISKGKMAFLVFKRSASVYFLAEEIQEESDGEAEVQEATGRRFKRIPGRWGKTHRIPEEIQLESEKGQVVFFPDGKIEKTKIKLCRQERCMTISTQVQQGRIYVFAEED